MDYRANYAQILDGFCYGSIYGTRPGMGGNWYWNCVANLDPLRLAAENYRPRVWVAPKDFFIPANPNQCNILPGKTNFMEIQVKARSYLWALNFAVFQNLDLESLNQNKFSVTITEAATGLALYERPSCAAGIQQGISSNGMNELKPQLELLASPRLILAPGLVHVSISNDADPADLETSALSCQLAMFFAEPKK